MRQAGFITTVSVSANRIPVGAAWHLSSFSTLWLPSSLPASMSPLFPLICSMYGSRGGGGMGVWTALNNHKNIGFLCNTSQDPLKSHKATKQAFNVGPSSACQRNAIPSMAFHWRATDDPFIAVLGSSIPLSTKKPKENNKKNHQVYQFLFC